VLSFIFAQPGHWLEPVTRLGLLGPAQPHGLSWAQPKNKKIKKQKSKKGRKNKIKNVYA
jgi:hypothetical protein